MSAHGTGACDAASRMTPVIWYVGFDRCWTLAAEYRTAEPDHQKAIAAQQKINTKAQIHRAIVRCNARRSSCRSSSRKVCASNANSGSLDFRPRSTRLIISLHRDENLIVER